MEMFELYYRHLIVKIIQAMTIYATIREIRCITPEWSRKRMIVAGGQCQL